MIIPRTRLILLATAIWISRLVGCAPAQDVLRFDGERAYQLLKAQVELGPRYPGTPGHSATHSFIVSELKKYASKYTTQDFKVTIHGKELILRNILALFNHEYEECILLAAHWDTRPTADCEITAEDRKRPIPGANDGASGVSVLLELARILHERKPKIGVLMVFFDGEDYGSTTEEMFLGSRYFAENLTKSLSAISSKPLRIRYGILLDMVGDRNLTIYREGNSLNSAPQVVNKVWSVAGELGYEKYFRNDVKYTIEDDHI
ncbi:MAG: M28 family peptidase, partial [Armatimonadota bacterium]